MKIRAFDLDDDFLGLVEGFGYAIASHGTDHNEGSIFCKSNKKLIVPR